MQFNDSMPQAELTRLQLQHHRQQQQEIQSGERLTGEVKWFDNSKGYGFLIADDLEEDVFIHYRNIISESEYKTLAEGQPVEFMLTKSSKGYQAAECSVMEEQEEFS